MSPVYCERCATEEVEVEGETCAACLAEIVADFQQARETDLRIDETQEVA